MNQEQKNDRFKLAHHRLVARALKRNPALLDEAREVVRAWQRGRETASYVAEWERVLSGSIDDVRREITRRTPALDRLRISSPFALTRTKVLPREDAARLRRIASRPRLEPDRLLELIERVAAADTIKARARAFIKTLEAR